MASARQPIWSCSAYSLLLAATLGCFSSCQSANRLEFGKGLDVPYVQTPPHVVTAMLRMAHVGQHDVVVDLGCGDGRVVVAAAKQFGARGVGYDIDPQRISEARENAARADVTERTRFVQRNLFDASISEATVITVFLLPSVLEKLRPRLLSDLAPGTRVVSHSFPLRNWKPVQKLEVEGRTLYLFSVPKMEDCSSPTPAGIDQSPPCLEHQSLFAPPGIHREVD
jgi:SAM-dependent methyltransferase